jgi:hypothetical protein
LSWRGHRFTFVAFLIIISPANRETHCALLEKRAIMLERRLVGRFSLRPTISCGKITCVCRPRVGAPDLVANYDSECAAKTTMRLYDIDPQSEGTGGAYTINLGKAFRNDPQATQHTFDNRSRDGNVAYNASVIAV